MQDSLPTDLYLSSQVKALDALAIQNQGVTGFTLMKRAAREVFHLLQEQWPLRKNICVFCGSGNNAGDGYIVAALAAKAGLFAQVICLSPTSSLKNDAKLAYEYALKQNVDIRDFVQDYSYHEWNTQETVIVDALLGIGLSGQVRVPYIKAIELINQLDIPVLAIDVPSGICADTGTVLGCAIQANQTMTFIGLKQGLLTSDACQYVGELTYTDLGVEKHIFEQQTPNSQRLNFISPLLGMRPKNSHKGMFGHVVIVAGDLGYGGAGILAAESALACGAGLVSLATRKEHVTAALTRRPEIMAYGVESSDDLLVLLDQASIIVLGPGLGKSEWSEAVFNICLERELPMVIDADGLSLLAGNFENLSMRKNWVLTPHPGEAARLLKTCTKGILADRFATATAIQEKYGGVCVLKGAGTIIASIAVDADKVSLSLCSAGNPAMSAPGTGDVLSGVIASLLAQGLSNKKAAEMGVWAHATAGDAIVKTHGKYLFASELIQSLRKLW